MTAHEPRRSGLIRLIAEDSHYFRFSRPESGPLLGFIR